MSSLFKNSWWHIVILVIILVLLFAFMTKLKQGNFFAVGSKMPDFAEPMTLIDNTFYNRPYKFSVSIPNRRWEVSWPEKIDSLIQNRTAGLILDTATWMVKLFQRHGNDSLAVIRIGVTGLGELVSSQQLAEQTLAELKNRYPAPDTIRVIKGVTSSGTRRQQAAYYMIGLPETSYFNYPYLIVMIVAHNQLAYTTLCQVRYQSYEILKPELETILRSFRVY